MNPDLRRERLKDAGVVHLVDQLKAELRDTFDIYDIDYDDDDALLGWLLGVTWAATRLHSMGLHPAKAHDIGAYLIHYSELVSGHDLIS